MDSLIDPLIDSLAAASLAALMCAEPALKIAATRKLHADWQAGVLTASPATDVTPSAILVPGRPERPLLVAPRQLKSRGLGSALGRASLLHAVAHIEFNAINLALDAVHRFRGMPAAYYADWLQVAVDEARHFELLADRLQALGHRYGDFPAHNGLWAAAVATAHSCLARMALVPRVLEARGLDVSPGMIERLRGAGDHASADLIEIILREEVAHVAAGTRWFQHCCRKLGLDPDPTFLALVGEHAAGIIRPPFNHDARSAAGFSEFEQLGLLKLVSDAHSATSGQPAGSGPI